MEKERAVRELPGPRENDNFLLDIHGQTIYYINVFEKTVI